MSDADLQGLSTRSAMPESSWSELESRPAVVPWRELRRAFIEVVARDFRQWISPDQPHYRDQLVVAAGRFDQGVRLLCDAVPRPSTGERLRVLDIGAGNGGVSLAFANDPRHEVFALDLVPNIHAQSLRREIAVPFAPVVANGAALPFATASLDVVLLLDVIEHMRSPALACSEIMRVLRPGGRCILFTPPRVPYLFRPDPHYGIRGLLLFPNEVQRFIVDNLLRRRTHTPSGAVVDAYDVEHIYWHVDEVVRFFPGPKRVEVLYERRYSPPGAFRWWMIKRPRYAIEEIRYRLRNFAFGHIVIEKM